MLTDQDIQKINESLSATFATKKDLDSFATKKDLEVFATKKDLEEFQNKSLEIFATKKDIEEVKSDIADLRELLQGLIVSTDKLAKSVADLTLEYAAVKTQMNRHEKWIKQIAEKVGVHLEIE